MPLLFLLTRLFSLFTLGLIALDVYLVHEWYGYKDTASGHDYARNCLIGAIALTAFMLLGRSLVRLMTGKSIKSRAGHVSEPKILRSRDCKIIEREDGSEIHVEFSGALNGQPLIMIHGWSNDCTEWYYQKQELGGKYRIVTYDLPGLGKSTMPANSDLSLSKMAEDLKAVIAHVGGNPVLWGHSIGGMIILTFCRNHSEEASKVKGLVLEHTTYINPVRTSAFSKLLTAIQKPVLEPLLHMHMLLSPYYRLKNWIDYLNGTHHLTNAMTSFAGTQTRGMVDQVALYTAKASPYVTAKGMLSMMKYDVSSFLKEVKNPTLIIAANKDILTKPSASHHMHSEIPNSQLIMVQPGGHMAVFERHREVSHAVDHFIESLRAGRPGAGMQPGQQGGSGSGQSEGSSPFAM
jgi:pimeloyl-ACP methyl ester carboxylesterase